MPWSLGGEWPPSTFQIYSAVGEATQVIGEGQAQRENPHTQCN